MKALLTLCLSVILLTACSKHHESNEYKTIELDLKAKENVKMSNRFGLELFKEMAALKTSNLMVSSLSVSQALGMTWNGANGVTLSEMSQVLGYPDESAHSINQTNQKIREAIVNSDTKVDMLIANSIWYNHNFGINDEFVSANRQYYDAEVRALDFSKSTESKGVINNWVMDKTNGRIKDLIKQISSDHVMFLVNAVYFNGKWTYRFNKENTQDEDFFLADGGLGKVPTMNLEADLDYYADEQMQGVVLPYGNGHFEMLVILPDEKMGLNGLLDALDEQLLDNIYSGMAKSGLSVFLPKFTFKSDLKLNSQLKEMGMPHAFSDNANFSRMSADAMSKLKISEVVHKTFIEVNEEGTEAAAATSVGMVTTSIGPSVTPQLRIDKPFIFLIREKDTGAILFIGQVYNPVN